MDVEKTVRLAGLTGAVAKCIVSTLKMNDLFKRIGSKETADLGFNWLREELQKQDMELPRHNGAKLVLLVTRSAPSVTSRVLKHAAHSCSCLDRDHYSVAIV